MGMPNTGTITGGTLSFCAVRALTVSSSAGIRKFLGSLVRVECGSETGDMSGLGVVLFCLGEAVGTPFDKMVSASARD